MKWLSVRARRLIFAAGVFLSFTGCGGRQGTISGKVTLDGKALPGGLVSIFDSEEQTRFSGIGRDGAFSVSNVAPGKAQVSVLTLSERRGFREPDDGSRAKESLGPYVPIPMKYLDKETSGLNLEVRTGKQDFEIQLKGEPGT